MCVNVTYLTYSISLRFHISRSCSDVKVTLYRLFHTRMRSENIEVFIALFHILKQYAILELNLVITA